MFRFENVTKQFSEQFVLQNFFCEIKPNEKVNISGRSGIGKTTLFRLLLGFEKPDSGVIYFRNQPLTDKLIWDLRREVAYVSQDLNIGTGKVQGFFDDTLSLKANLVHKSNAQHQIHELFDYFELPESMLLKNIEGLSGGEKQRIAIVNALLLKRKIFLLDEISSALDKSLKAKTLDYFFCNPDFTVLSISHDNYMPSGVELKTIKLENL